MAKTQQKYIDTSTKDVLRRLFISLFYMDLSFLPIATKLPSRSNQKEIQSRLTTSSQMPLRKITRSVQLN